MPIAHTLASSPVSSFPPSTGLAPPAPLPSVTRSPGHGQHPLAVSTTLLSLVLGILPVGCERLPSAHAQVAAPPITVQDTDPVDVQPEPQSDPFGSDPDPIPRIPPSWPANTFPLYEWQYLDQDCGFEIELIEAGLPQEVSESRRGRGWIISQHISSQDGYLPLYYGTGISSGATVNRDRTVQDHIKVRITLSDCDGKVIALARPVGHTVAHSSGMSKAAHQVRVRVDSLLTEVFVVEKTPWQVAEYSLGPAAGGGGSVSIGGFGGGAQATLQGVYGGGTLVSHLSNDSEVREDTVNIITHWTEEFEVWVAQRNYFWAAGSLQLHDADRSLGRGFVGHWNPVIAVTVAGGPSLGDWVRFSWGLD